MCTTARPDFMGAMRPGMGHPEAGDLRNQRFGSAMVPQNICKICTIFGTHIIYLSIMKRKGMR